MQAEQHAYPLLLMFGEGCPAPPEPAAALVAALPGLRDIAELTEALQRLALNLLCQLGGLCAEHTRKATILQGQDVKAAGSMGPRPTLLTIQLPAGLPIPV